MTTANKLTLCRVVMIPIFIVLLYQDFTHHLLAALGVFILASITDFVDGYVARHYSQVTDFAQVHGSSGRQAPGHVRHGLVRPGRLDGRLGLLHRHRPGAGRHRPAPGGR
ncbi:MAG: CDP-alcohol phosphatidyltransferase family protein [Evtepia sp.]